MKYLLPFWFSLFSLVSIGQSLGPTGFNPFGGRLEGTSGSLSYAIGQSVGGRHIGASGEWTIGVIQQGRRAAAVVIFGDSVYCPDEVMEFSIVGGNEVDWYYVTDEPAYLGTGASIETTFSVPGYLRAESSGGDDSLFTVQQELSACPYDLIIYGYVTPNEDEANEFWDIEKIEYAQPNHVQVFNRWGKEVYATQNYQGSWKAEGLEAGNYWYHFYDGNQQRSYEGRLVIER